MVDMGEVKEIKPKFHYMTGNDFIVTDEVLNHFNENGYVLVKGLLNEAEVTKLKTEIESNEHVFENEQKREDGDGKWMGMTWWNHPSKDVTGMITRCEKVAGTFEKLLGGEVYNYHNKITMKRPFVSGAFTWHQDYGYWYYNGFLFPNAGTTWIAIDKADRENGCLKIIPGSHKLGRIDHHRVAGQTEADIERVQQILNVLGIMHVEVDPGDALFFHCNVLHRSDPNKSPNRRWSYLPCYNRADNDPVVEHHHPHYTPMTKVPNSAILECQVSMKNGGIQYGGFVKKSDDSDDQFIGY